MRKLLLAFALLLLPSAAWAQCNGVFANNMICGNVSGSPAPPGPIPNAVGPGGISGQIQYNNAGSFAGATTGQGILFSGGVLSAFPAASSSSATGGSRAFSGSDCGNIVIRSNTGTVMTDTLPSSPLSANCVVTVLNNDASAFYGVQAAGSTQLNGTTNGYQLLGPGQAATFQSNGSNYFTLSAPVRAKLAIGTSLTLFIATTGSDTNMPLVSGTPWLTIQQCWNYVQANIDIGNNKGGAGVVCQLATGTYTASNNQGGGNAALNAAGTIPGQNTLIGLTIQGDCVTPSNTFIHPGTGSIIGADDYAGLAIGCVTVQVGSANAAVFVSQHHAFVAVDDKVTVAGGAQTGSALQAQDRGHIIQFGTLTITGGTGAGSTATASVQSSVEVTGTLVLTNTTSLATYQASDGSVIVSSGVVYSASGATITNKYVLTNGGYLNTGGACSSVPGTGTSVDGFSNCH